VVLVVRVMRLRLVLQRVLVMLLLLLRRRLRRLLAARLLLLLRPPHVRETAPGALLAAAAAAAARARRLAHKGMRHIAVCIHLQAAREPAQALSRCGNSDRGNVVPRQIRDTATLTVWRGAWPPLPMSHLHAAAVLRRHVLQDWLLRRPPPALGASPGGCACMLLLLLPAMAAVRLAILRTQPRSDSNSSGCCCTHTHDPRHRRCAVAPAGADSTGSCAPHGGQFTTTTPHTLLPKPNQLLTPLRKLAMRALQACVSTHPLPLLLCCCQNCWLALLLEWRRIG
jgi:hypothetical protein